MINYIWGLFIVLGVFYSIMTNNTSVSNTMLVSGSNALRIVINLIPLMCLWLGIMNIAKRSGLLDIMSHKLSYIIRFIFPEIPVGDPSISYISSNIIMNIFGLGSVATPFGIKAMKELKRLNSDSDNASRSMITFIAINTSSVTLIPTTIISLRIASGSINPSSIVEVSIISTILSTIIAIILDRILYYIWIRYD